MKIKSGELEQRLSKFRQSLRKAGVKLTHQRLEIFREVAKSGDHPDAETIFKGISGRLPALSLDTVYRTLWLLLDLGLINTMGTPRARTRFDANMLSHHHFVCTNCGMARDFYCRELDHLKVPETVKALGSTEKMQVEIRGVCLNCLKKANHKHCATRKKEEQ